MDVAQQISWLTTDAVEKKERKNISKLAGNGLPTQPMKSCMPCMAIAKRRRICIRQQPL